MKFLLFTLFFFTVTCYAQLPYTQRQYGVRKDSAVVAGVSVNYCGMPDTIKVNIYKPVGDTNKERPVAIFAHGGGFTSPDNAHEYQMSVFAEEFARRGYVGVSIDYREGFHLHDFAPGLPAPANADLATLFFYNNLDGGAFATDSAEYIRAIYRAQQDMKGVIRFMKGNHFEDSTSTCKYFIGGFSAGAITALTAAFMDVAAEKPAEAGQLNGVANPAWQNNFFQIPGPAGKDDADYQSHNPYPFDYNAAACYQRPNLGNINGGMAVNGYDEKILGVMAISGAVSDSTLFDNSTQQPAVYLYHVPSDDVVPFGVDHPLKVLGYTFTPPPSVFTPVLYGSNWIWDKLNRSNYPAAKRKLFYTEPLPFLMSPHNIFPDAFVMSDSVAKFFAEVLEANVSCIPAFTDSFIFTGNGNWDVQQNWISNRVPLSPVVPGIHVIIRPQAGGACILNVPVTVNRGALLSVEPGAAFNILGNLRMQ